jgi:hypothetical protein
MIYTLFVQLSRYCKYYVCSLSLHLFIYILVGIDSHGIPLKNWVLERVLVSRSLSNKCTICESKRINVLLASILGPVDVGCHVLQPAWK